MRLADANSAVKIVVTAFVLVLAVSMITSALLLKETALSCDDDAILPNAEDLTIRFNASPLESAIHGEMGRYLTQGHDREAVLKWLRAGGQRTGFYEKVEPILARHCTSCHGASSTIAAGVSLVLYSDVEPYATRRGPSVKELLGFTHIHLFGIGTLLFLMGILMGLTRFSIPIRIGLALIPILALFTDIICWWWIRTWSGAAQIGLYAGLLLFASAGISALFIIFDLWWPRSAK
ncbi:MAG: hypothetical protein GY847_10890 [Proteobacteria bacterium]|nr:hypothetical protein [Pseudomonadota bacterium]